MVGFNDIQYQYWVDETVGGKEGGKEGGKKGGKEELGELVVKQSEMWHNDKFIVSRITHDARWIEKTGEGDGIERRFKITEASEGVESTEQKLIETYGNVQSGKIRAFLRTYRLDRMRFRRNK